MEEAINALSKLYSQVGLKRKTVSATAPIMWTKRFSKPAVTSFAVDNRA